MDSARHQRQLLTRAAERLIPLDVSLELTHRCNFRCGHCYLGAAPDANELPVSRWLILLDELAEMGTLYLSFTGGEILLLPDWLAVARRARRLGFVLRLFSNASLVTPELADAIAGLDARVDVSLYAAEQRIFEQITQTPGSFERTLRGIELLRERQVEVMLKVPVMTTNLAWVATVYEYAERIGAGCSSDPRIMRARDDDSGPLRFQVPAGDMGEYLRSPWSPFPQRPTRAEGDRDEQPLCGSARRFASITANGDVMACLAIPGSAGNISKAPFRAIWNDSPWLNRIRAIRRSDLEDCAACGKLSYCKRCHGKAMAEDGDLLGTSSWSCAFAEAVDQAWGVR